MACFLLLPHAYTLTFSFGKHVSLIIFQTERELLPLLYCFQNLSADLVSDCEEDEEHEDEDNIDEEDEIEC